MCEFGHSHYCASSTVVYSLAETTEFGSSGRYKTSRDGLVKWSWFNPATILCSYKLILFRKYFQGYYRGVRIILLFFVTHISLIRLLSTGTNVLIML